MSLRILSGENVEYISASFSPLDLQVLMAQVFHAVSSSGAIAAEQGIPNVQVPHRTTLQTESHRILFMPARLGVQSFDPSSATAVTGRGTSIKIVSVPKRSDPRGLPGTTVVMDEATGGVKAVANARMLTALRNAAGSLLSTSLIAKRPPRRIVAFGAGNQILSHLDLHVRFFPQVEKCTIINRTLNERVKRLVTRLSQSFGNVQISALAGDAGSQVEEVVKAADLIICATSSTEPLFPSSWVNSGTHIVLIGSYTPQMQEVDGDTIRRSLQGKGLFVDSREACLKEAGELIKAKLVPEDILEVGQDLPVDKSGDLNIQALRKSIEGNIQGRESETRTPDFGGPVTLFKSVGIGLQDVAIGAAVVSKAEELGLGCVIDDYDA